jgi:hypothetical protein
MLAEEEAGGGAYADEDYAEGEWVKNAETGELEWHPAEGGPALTADQWEHAGEESTPSDDNAAGGPEAEDAPAPPSEAPVPAAPGGPADEASS